MLSFDILLAGVINGLAAGAIYVLVAVGLTLIYGVLHIINFAHGSLLMLAMYGVYFLFRSAKLDPYMALPIVMAGSFVFGYLLYRLVIGRFSHGKDENILLITLGLSIIIAVGQVVYYYRDHVPLFERQAREFKAYPDGYDMAIRAKDVPDFTDIYLIADPIPDINVPRIWVSFLTKSDPATLRHIPLATSDFTPDFIAALPVGRNFAFFIDSQARDQIALMTSAFGCPIETSPYAIDPPTKAYVLCFKEME